jgi:hypothetical protein
MPLLYTHYKGDASLYCKGMELDLRPAAEEITTVVMRTIADGKEAVRHDSGDEVEVSRVGHVCLLSMSSVGNSMAEKRAGHRTFQAPISVDPYSPVPYKELGRFKPPSRHPVRVPAR